MKTSTIHLLIGLFIMFLFLALAGSIKPIPIITTDNLDIGTNMPSVIIK